MEQAEPADEPDVDAARLAQFYARAMHASSAMTQETQKSQKKQEELRSRVGTGTVQQWYTEHQAVCDQRKRAAHAKDVGNEAAKRGEQAAMEPILAAQPELISYNGKG